MKYFMRYVTGVVLCWFASFAPNGAFADGVDGLKIGLSGLMAGGGSTVGNADLPALQGGGHDPKLNGFTLQNIELSLGAAVDHYFDAQVNTIFLIDESGETVVELEEAFFVTRALPAGLQIKGGQFYTELGRQNSAHPHTWWFADQPIINSRIFSGDGLRSVGARVSWLIPASWYSELLFGVQNPLGETQISFLGGDGLAGHDAIERQVQRPRDLMHSMRWLNGFDISDTLSANIGVSMAGGANNSGDDTMTRITGVDTYFKWQAESSQHGFPFVAWHTEFWSRRYEAGATDAIGAENLQDQGFFSQLAWGYAPRYVLGARYEQAWANEGDTSGWDRADRSRVALNWTWYPTEFSKLRIQYNYDQTDLLVDEHAHSVWLQVEYNIGSHMAHVF